MVEPTEPVSARGNPAALRWSNRRRLLGSLSTSGPQSQAELSRSTGLSAASVSNLVRELAAESIVAVCPSVRGGRPVSEVALVAGNRLVLGVDLGHRHVRAALADSQGTILVEFSEPRSAVWQLDRDVDLLTGVRDRVLADAGVGPREIGVAAIGVPVPFESAGVMPGRLAGDWAQQEAAAVLGAALGIPVQLENDANLGALGEARRGAGRGFGDFIYVKLAHGVGAGLVLGSRLYHGGLGAAGEIGHISVDTNGPLCSCGGRGCLELYVGGRAIAAALAEVHGARPSLGDIVDNCLRGEPSYVRAVDDAGRQLGTVLGTVANLLAPRRIVLGGELSRTGELLVEAVRHTLRHGASASLSRGVEVVVAQLGDRAELMGAVEMGASRLRAELGIPTTDQLLDVDRATAQPAS